MSKTIPAKKKVEQQQKKSAVKSSTDSSTASSTDSSSSSSSSSGSGSSSSSDSDSSSSQNSSPKQSSAEQKKTGPLQKSQRKSTESKNNTTKAVEKPKPKPPSKVEKPPPKPTYSSEDEEPPKVPPNKAIKKKSIAKPKSTATVTPKTLPPPVKQTGGKVPPKANPAKAQQNKNRELKSKTNKANKNDPKKKSIFSPENSSESENEQSQKAEKASLKNQAIKIAAPKPRSKASVKPVEKAKVAKKEVVKPKPKEVSSASSAASSSDSSSSSDSESSAESTASAKKVSKTSQKKPVNNKEANSDSETESKQTATRKLTRSANARKSKHVLGTNVYTDTDSDTESTKRSLSRSPVKKAPVSTKGKTKNRKSGDNKAKSNEVLVLEERKCPIESCNSFGHLGGRQDKHFTIDACPFYHNSQNESCKENLLERKKREEFRKKLIEGSKKSPKNHQTPEQKAYLNKIREARSKFKSEPVDESKVVLDKNREPNLDNFVVEYDLKLFRDAQALASEKIEEELKTQPNTKGTKYIEMGKFEMEVWYQSPYPEEFARLPKLYICEYCLRYMRGRTVLQRHAAKCVWRHPPGEEVYRKDKISVWEVDGKRYKQYCQNLCLLAKFFLDHKTLYYDVEPFLFYVMTMLDSEGCHTVGYFSKEKNSFLNYNVSCILTLPPYQRQGYGRLLIDFSYLLTRVEGKIGSPEKPLSDLGLISYRSYWKDVLLGYLCSRAGTELSVKDISQEMAIHSTDIVSTLQALGMMKYWKGKHIILKKQDVLDEYVDRVKRRGSMLKEVDPTCLRWTPFVPPQPNPS